MNISARRSMAKHVGLFFQLPGSRLLCALLVSFQVLLPSLASALPIDGNVVAGQATIQKVSPTTLSIAQASDKAILNWNSFSIAANEAVHFTQPSVTSIALNRVIGVDPSVILGQLQANGRIFLINPNGILFGAGAQINVSGLLATTLQTRDEDFMDGRYLFAQDPLKGLKTVVNRGTIHVSDNGYVVLMAPGVSNEGMIVANLGTALLGSGQKFTLDLMGDGLIRYAINDKVLGQMTDPDGKPLSSAVSNSGTIQADGGQVILSARASGDVFSSVVNQSGVIRARSLENHGGVVQLLGGDETLAAATSAGAMRPVGDVSGAVVNTGMIDVASGAPNAAQGSVTMVGERVGQFGSIVATGAEGANGGEVVIASTTRTLLARGSTIDVSGSGHSSGGRLRVWSDQETFFNVDATILARGGELGGNGGFIELSGKENLGFAGSVNALAPFGSAGTLLLDPRNITIQTAGGSAYNPGVNNLFGNTPAANVIITPASINAAAANVVLQANNDITVTNAIAMINNGVGITMQAGRDILVNAGVSTTNGNISMTANDSSSILANRANGAAGDIIFGVGANLSSSIGNISLTINPATAGNYAPGSITTARNLTTTTGDITLNSPNTVSLSGAVNAGSGTVSMNANSDGAGAQSFTMNAGSSITATNAVAVTVNAAGGGTGAATLRNINTGLGSLAVTTNPGGNTVGGGITQVAGSTITAGGGAQITTGNGNISLQNVTTNGNLLVSSRNTVTLIGAVNTGSGTVSMNANSDGAGAQSFTMNAGSSIATTNTGANAVQVIVNSPTGGTGAASLRGSITTGNGGTETVSTRGQAAVGGNTTGGAITQGAVLTMNTGAAGTIALATGAAASNITLNTAGNDFTGTVGVSRAFNVALRDANALTLGASTISGTLGVTTAGTLTQSGALTVTGVTTLTAGAANNITLDGANNFSTVAVTSGNNVTLNDNNALIMGASTISGTLGVTTAGALTQSGVLNVSGMTTLDAGAANNINLATSANNFSTVAITSGNNVSLRDTNALVLGTSTVNGALALTTGGALSQSGALNVMGTSSFTATAANTDILLDTQANNLVGAISFGGTLSNIRDVGLRNTNAGATIPSLAGLTNLRNLTLTFDNAPVALPSLTLTAGGNLNVTAGGSITETGAVTVPGTTTLDTTVAGSDILLNTQANNFGGAIALGGTQTNVRDLGLRNVNVGATVPTLAGLTNLRNLTLTFDTAPMVLPSLTASGNLTATAGGLISQSGALNVADAANFDTIAAATIGSVTLANGGALTLNTSTVGGNLTVTTAAGDLTLPAGQTLTVVGDATLSPAGTVNLLGTTRIGGTQSSVGGTGSTFVLGADTNLNALALPAAGDITVNLTGNTASFAGAPLLPQVITLGNAGNIFGGPLSVTTAAPAFTGTTTNTYNLTQSAPVNLNVGQGLTVTDLAGTAGTRGNITLTNAGNIFNTVTFIGGNIDWVETGPVIIGGVSANAGATSTGTLSITATGLITQTGAVTAGGASTLAAGANDITLTNAANNFSTVGITSGNNVALTDVNALDLGASTISGILNMTTNGALTQSGALSVTGTTTLAAGAANDITLNNAANNFSTVGITSGNNVILVDAIALNLAALMVSGNLTVTTGGTLTQSGALTVTGTTNLASTAANSDILLDTQANNFGGTVAFGGTQANIRDVSLRNANAGATVPALAGFTNLRNLSLTFDAAPINFPTLNASGNLSATAGGSITQSGALTVGGATTLTTTVAGSDFLLNTQANNFGGAVAFGGTQTNIRDIGLRNLNAGAIIPALAGVTNLRNLTLTFDNALIALPSLTSSGSLNATAGGTITQTGALTIAGITTLAAGANDITLNNAANNFSTVGITSGNNVALTDVNALTLNASTVSGNFSANAGDLTVGGTVASAGGALNLTSANSVTQLANLTAAGANSVTVTTAGGPITMAAAATTTSGTGGINYAAGADVTLASLSTGGGVNVSAGGSVLSAAGSGTNVTAGANSTLQAFNGVVGTQAAPINVAVNPGTLGIRATKAIGGISAFLTGTVLPGNALTLLNVPPGLVCFNICPVTSVPVSGLGRSTFGYLNPDTIIPAYYPQPSGSVLISDITSVYMPGTLLQPSPVSLSPEDPAVQSMGPKAKAGASCKQGETVPNQQAAAASLDVRCAVQ